MSISFDLSSVSSNKVAALFDRFPQQARAELEQAIRGITNELEALVKASEPVRTGQLQSSTIAYVIVEQNKIQGRIKIAGASGAQIFAKAAALEYGAHGSNKVKAHSRIVTTVFGRLVDPTTQSIAAFTRTSNIAEHDFLRGPLKSQQGAILDRLRAALDAAAQRVKA